MEILIKKENGSIIFEQGFSFSTVSEDISELDTNLRAELNRLNAELQRNEQKMKMMEYPATTGSKLLKEIKALYPDVKALSYTEAIEYTARTDSASITADSSRVSTVIVNIPANKLKIADRKRIDQWLHERLDLSRDLRIVYTSKE